MSTNLTMTLIFICIYTSMWIVYTLACLFFFFKNNSLHWRLAFIVLYYFCYILAPNRYVVICVILCVCVCVQIIRILLLNSDGQQNIFKYWYRIIELTINRKLYPYFLCIMLTNSVFNLIYFIIVSIFTFSNCGAF